MAFDVEKILRVWLNRLSEQSDNYLKLFSTKELKSLSKQTKENCGVVIPIPFKDGTMVDI